MPPSSSSAASASLPRMRQTPPRIWTGRGRAPPARSRARPRARGWRARRPRRSGRGRAPLPASQARRRRGGGRARRRTATSTSAAASAAVRVGSLGGSGHRRPRARAWRAPPRSGPGLRAVSPRSPRARPTSCIASYLARQNSFTASSIMQRDRLGRGRAPGGSSRALARRACRPARVARGGAPPRRRPSRAVRASASTRCGTIASASSSALMAVGEMAGRRQRPRTGEQELDALLRRRGLREQPQRRRRTSRAALAGASRAAASPASRRTATAATSPSRAERSTWWARAAAVAPRAASASAHRSWAPSRQPPARGLVDRAPDERVPEAKAPRHVGAANEIEPQELVDRVHRRTPRMSRPRPPPARARTDRPPPPLLRARRRASSDSSAELLAQRGGDGRRDPDAARARSRQRGVGRAARSSDRASCSR